MGTSVCTETYSEDEVNLLSQIIREAYSDTLATDTWLRVLEMLDRAVPYASAGAIFANVQTGRLDNRLTCKVGPELLQWYDQHFGAIGIIASVALSRGMDLWRPSEVIGREEWETSEIRMQLRDRFGLGEPVCMTCGSAEQIAARFWFVREVDKSDFSEREQSILRLLRPHICTSLRLAKALLDGDVYRESWQQTMMPRFILNDSGRITDMNRKAAQLAAEGDGKGYLARIEAIARDMLSQRLTLQNAELGGTRCRVWLSAVTLPNAPKAYTLAIDTAADIRKLLRQAIVDAGCSEREVEVCMMLAYGASNHEIAEKLFISEATVKDHVTNVFDKLGVENRSAVIPRLLGL